MVRKLLLFARRPEYSARTTNELGAARAFSSKACPREGGDGHRFASRKSDQTRRSSPVPIQSEKALGAQTKSRLLKRPSALVWGLGLGIRALNRCLAGKQVSGVEVTAMVIRSSARRNHPIIISFSNTRFPRGLNSNLFIDQVIISATLINLRIFLVVLYPYFRGESKWLRSCWTPRA